MDAVMEQEVRQPLLIVGSVAFDSVETPQGRADMALGGSASYAAMRSYFSRPQVVGIVGDDFHGHHMTKFHEHGVDVRGIESIAGRPSTGRGATVRTSCSHARHAARRGPRLGATRRVVLPAVSGFLLIPGMV
jgi:sugar/nucleoside kinase (ribokinase family)